MKKLGITGGVGSGKSRVLKLLEETYHARVYQADEIAKRIQEPGNACYEQIVKTFGREICLEGGGLDRKKLGRLVFSDRKKLETLNALVHPAVNEEIVRLIAREESRGTGLFVLEAALLAKPWYREILDEIWYIRVEREVRMERLAASREYTKEQTESMMASQPREEEFLAFADRVIDNSGEFSETARQIRQELKRLEQGEAGTLQKK